MADVTSPPIQQPQPAVPLPGFAAGLPIPGQPVIPGQIPPIPAAVPGEPTPAAASEENACETLYIQNLNEKVKPQGAFVCSFESTSNHTRGADL